MNLQFLRIHALWLLWVWLWMPLPTAGQTAATGALSGVVTDPSGAGMENVVVKVTSLATGIARETASDAGGIYLLSLLPPGSYSLMFSANGFANLQKSNLEIHVAQIERFDVSMRVATRTEFLQLVADSESVHTQSSSLGTLVGEKAIKGLPLTNRNYTQILHLSSGVAADLTNAAETGRNTQDVYVNGMRAIDNNYQMDGISINNSGTERGGDWLGYSGIAIPNPDAIQEFKVQTHLYDAGFGRNVGANVNVVTRSGSNAWHGSVFEFFRNEVLNANDFFLNRNRQPRPPNKQNQFGGVLGGPLLRDRFFFFGSYQGTRQVNGLGSGSLRSVFLPPLSNDRSRAALGAIFSGQRGLFQNLFGGIGPAILPDGSNINPAALALLNQRLTNGQYLIPTPQVILPNGLGSSVYSVPSHFTEDQFLLNFDSILSSRQTLSGRWFYSRDPQTTGFPAQDVEGTNSTPGSGTSSSFQNRFLVVKLLSVWTPSLLNEGKFGFVRNTGRTATANAVKTTDIGMAPAADQEGIPLILFPGLFSIGGAFNDGTVTAIDSFQFGDQISWLHGKHNLRTGLEYERVRNNIDLYGVKRGGLLLLSFPDFLLGSSAAQNGTPFSNVFLSLGASGITDRQYRANNWAAFLQDDFKVHPRLTLNLGLRWEIHGQLSETRGRLVNFLPKLASNDFTHGGTLSGFVAASNFQQALPEGVMRSQNKSCCNDAAVLSNWGPRIGLAWQPLHNNSRLAIRAGYGIYYSRTSGNDVAQLLLQQPFMTLSDASGPANGLATLQVPFNPALSPASAYPLWSPRGASTQLALANLASNWNSPKAQQYNLNLQYELFPSTLLELGYAGARGTRLLRYREANQARLASLDNPINGMTENSLGNVARRVPVLGLAPTGLRQLETAGDLWHNALLASITRRFRRGLQFQGAYTFGKTLDNTPASAGFTSVWGGFFSNDVNAARQAWGPADFNRRQRFVAYYLWEIPQLRNKRRRSSLLLNGWQLSGVTTFQSGRPITVIDQRAGSIYGASSTLFFQQRAQLCPGFNHKQISTTASVDSRLHGFFNSEVFCLPPMIGDGFGYGDLGRGVVFGPDQRNFDIALTKRTPLGDQAKRGTLEFRSEFFNAFNTPQFADPARDFGAPGFGSITATSVSPRLIQFALKYSF